MNELNAEAVARLEKMMPQLPMPVDADETILYLIAFWKSKQEKKEPMCRHCLRTKFLHHGIDQYCERSPSLDLHVFSPLPE